MLGLQADSGSNNDWEQFCVPSQSCAASPFGYLSISVGINVALIGDVNGVVWSFSYQAGSSKPYQSVSSLIVYSGSAVSILYSYYVQIASVIPPLISILPSYSVGTCGFGSFNCPRLSLAVQKYKMVGTTFIYESGVHADGAIMSSVNDLKITSRHGSSQTIVDCQSGSCFLLSGNSVIMEGLSVVNGSSNSGGCVSVSNGMTMSISDSVFTNCRSATNGGAIIVGTSSQLDVKRSVFRSNVAVSSGGAIYFGSSSKSNLTDCLISDNQALKGAGIGGYKASWIQLVRDEFISNVASSRGGGIDLEQCKSSISSSLVRSNVAPQGAGLNLQDSTLTLLLTSFLSNVASINGGGIFSSFSNSTLTNVTLSNNIVSGASTATGGGFYCLGKRGLNIKNSWFSGNVAGYEGGGFAAIFCNPVISSTMIYNNSASIGGGLFIGLQATSSIQGTSVIRNQASLSGGGFAFQYASPSVIMNSTIDSNYAASQGAGLYNYGQGVVVLSRVVFSSNYAPFGAGGAIWWNSVAPVESNVMFSSNIALQGPDHASDIQRLECIQSVPVGFIGSSNEVIKNQSLVFQLVDFYNQTVTVENSTSLSLVAKSESTNFVGVSVAPFVSGVATFASWGVTRTPNSSVSINVISFFKSVGSLRIAKDISFSLRACIPGEYNFFGIQCIPCATGYFSDGYMKSECSSCTYGYYQERTGQTRCDGM